jgi:Fic family protein
VAAPEPQLDPGTTAIVTRLDRLISLLRVVHSDELATARAGIRKDKANAAILDATDGRWAAAGTLRDQVVRQTGLKQAAVRARIAELVDAGALERQGGGRTTEYRSTGLV